MHATITLAVGDEALYTSQVESHESLALFLVENAAAYGLPADMAELDEEQLDTLKEAYEQRNPGASFVPQRPAPLALPPLAIYLHPSSALTKTVTNFAELCTGARGIQKKAPHKPIWYKGTPIHRVEKGFVLQGGDFTRGDGSGGDSIYGGPLLLEKAGLKPAALDPPIKWGPGTLAMAASSSGKSTSQFFICLTDDAAQLKKLDGKYVAFGRVDGPPGWQEVLRMVEERAAAKEKVWIHDCGVLPS
ncbi:cyclophilin-like protein [Auricularia subglabra TFB-10046 SS5]|nr:cyclophilin-like protein [Auricularia subglabra TFB-10046 SS5]